MLIKTLIVGNTGVGKSCWMNRLVDNSFSQALEITIGVDYKSMIIGADKFQIWDTAGVIAFRQITRSYYRNADCMIVVCDLTVAMAQWDLDRWFEDINTYAVSGIPIYLVANKADSGQVKEENLRILEEGFVSNRGNIPSARCFITSAKTGAGLQECIQKILSDLKTMVARYEVEYGITQSTDVPYTIDEFKSAYRRQHNNQPHPKRSGMLSKLDENLTFQTVFTHQGYRTKAVLREAGFRDLEAGYVISQDGLSVSRVNASQSIYSLLTSYGALPEVVTPATAVINNIDVLLSINTRMTSAPQQLAVASNTFPSNSSSVRTVLPHRDAAEETLDRIIQAHVVLSSTPVRSAASSLSASSAMFSHPLVENIKEVEIIYKGKAPDEYYSPITYELMENPVIIIETEQVCDRKDVEAWFATGKKTCPIIRKSLSGNGPHYIRNLPLKNLIEDWKKANKVGVNVPASEGPK